MKLNLMQNKTMLISVSLILALTSCGKSKDLKTAPPEAAAPTAEPTSAPDKAPAKTPAKNPPKARPKAAPTTTQDDQPKPFTPPNDDEMDGPTDLPPRQTQTPVNNQIPNENDEIENLPPLPSSQDQAPGAQANGSTPSLAAEGRAYQVDFTKQVAVKTGGKAQDLFYTGAGRDGILEEFKSYMVKVTPEQQKMNANLAKAVVLAKLVRTSSSGETSITMSFNEFGAVKNYRLQGSSDGNMMKLNISKAGTTGAMEFQGGFLKCLDADGGCENSYAKMKFAGGYVRVIFRNSSADMHFQYEENVHNNSGFAMWLNYVINSSRSEPVAQTFDSLQLSSYEVINGSAAMGAMLTTHDREMIGLKIPLLVSGNFSDVSVPVAKLNDVEANNSAYSKKLLNAATAIKLIKNNGMGQIKLAFSFNDVSIWLVAARVQKETLSLQEIRKFESQLKKF